MSFADDVDAAILNFINNINYWGAVADNNSSEAITKLAALLNTDLQKAELKAPKLLSIPNTQFSLTIPSNITSDNIAQTVERNLRRFFDSNFSDDILFNKIFSNFTSALTNPYDFPGRDKINALWYKSKQNTIALGNDVDGLKKPALACSISTSVNHLFPDDIYINSLIDSAALSFRQFVLSVEIQDLRRSALLASSEYIAVLLAAEYSGKNLEKRVYISETQLQKTLYELYIQSINNSYQNLKANAVNLDLSTAAAIIKSNFYNDLVSSIVSAAITVSRNLSSLTQTAIGATNSIISNSVTGFGD